MSNENPHRDTLRRSRGLSRRRPDRGRRSGTTLHSPHTPHAPGSASGSLHRWAQPRRDARLRAVWPVPLRAASRASRSRRRPVGSTMAHWSSLTGLGATAHGARRRAGGARPPARGIRDLTRCRIFIHLALRFRSPRESQSGPPPARWPRGARDRGAWRVAACARLSPLGSPLSLSRLGSPDSASALGPRSVCSVEAVGRGSSESSSWGGQRRGGAAAEAASAPARPLALLRQPAHCTAQGTDPRSTAR